MPSNKKTVTESEYEIMQVLWKSEIPLNAAEVTERVADREWKLTTVATLLTRLTNKGAVKFEKSSRNYYYSPVLKENDYKIGAAKSLLSRIYNGSIKNMVAALYEGNEISDEDIAELKKMFDLGGDNGLDI